MSHRSCEVNLNTPDCEHPPCDGSRDCEMGRLRTRCYGCGGVACKGCSRIRTDWLWVRRRVRICNDCVREYQA